MTTTGTKYVCEYGTNEPGKPQPISSTGKSWARYDRYTPNDGRATIVELRFVAGPDDLSDQHWGDYDGRCNECWLNFSHSEDRHQQQLA